MPSHHKNTITLSILDRLIDEEPDKKIDSPISQQQQLLNLRASICRDLEMLLNAKPSQLSWPKVWLELNTSLFAYGIPDIVSLSLDNAEAKKQFCRELSDIIKRFETRLKNTTVHLIENYDEGDRVIHLRIQGLLLIEPTPETIIFDSILEPNSNNFRKGSFV
jgi:type VI secretion system protein ImpF